MRFFSFFMVFCFSFRRTKVVDLQAGVSYVCHASSYQIASYLLWDVEKFWDVIILESAERSEVKDMWKAR